MGGVLGTCSLTQTFYFHMELSTLQVELPSCAAANHCSCLGFFLFNLRLIKMTVQHELFLGGFGSACCDAVQTLCNE